MMKDLINLLHKGGYSLVVANGEICTFNGRGISDLYRLLQEDPGFLHGALVADKVIGKAAAGLMIRGGVIEAYADTISTPAIALLRENGVKVTFTEEVHHIINRTKDGWCPMEKACYELQSVDEICHAVQDKIRYYSTSSILQCVHPKRERGKTPE